MATYSDTQKASALAYLDACKGNISKAARDCKVPRQTLQLWAKGRHVSVDVPEIRQEKKEALADVFERLAYKAAAQVEVTIDECSASQAATVAAIATDKMQLLRSKPTAITESTATHEHNVSIAGLDPGEALRLYREAIQAPSAV